MQPRDPRGRQPLRRGVAPTHWQGEDVIMKGLFRVLLAGWGAKKFGGGCISTVLIFVLLFWLLGLFF